MLIRREDFEDISLLTPGSNKEVWFTCEDCGIGVLQIYKNYVKQKDGKFCRTCRNRRTANRKDVKEKQSKRIKEAWKNEDYRTKVGNRISASCKETWLSGKRKVNVHNKTKYEDLKGSLESLNYKLITTEEEYEKPKEEKGPRKVKVECPYGHTFETIVSRWNQGSRCKQCQKVDWNNIVESFKKEGYELLSVQSEYENNNTKLMYKCPKGHEHSITWSNWILEHRCPSCASHISKGETELHEYIKSICGDVIFNDRLLISPMELDIVIPYKRIALEYCGLYWHGEQKGKDKNYHLNKLNGCLKKGYRLITIFEDEWNTKNELVKGKLKHLLGEDITERIYARKTKIGEISSTEAKIFCEKYHIQGYTSCSIKLGAYYGIELVAVMTFSKPSISKGRKDQKGNDWELSRFCTSKRVIGAAGKLFEFFKKHYQWDNIYSFADRRWSDGNLYRKIGFNEVDPSQPNYWYFDTKQPYKKYHRFNFRKDALKDKLEVFDASKTEYENMLVNGYDRIWDCGNFKFELKNRI